MLNGMNGDSKVQVIVRVGSSEATLMIDDDDVLLGVVVRAERDGCHEFDPDSFTFRPMQGPGK